MKFACPWEEVEGFISLVEFRSFERWMIGQVSAGMARQVPVAIPFRHGDEEPVPVEVWYLHLMSREVWRLVLPEPPFDGMFKKIPSPPTPWPANPD
jgi:hypothetical protein